MAKTSTPECGCSPIKLYWQKEAVGCSLPTPAQMRGWWRFAARGLPSCQILYTWGFVSTARSSQGCLPWHLWLEAGGVGLLLPALWPHLWPGLPHLSILAGLQIWSSRIGPAFQWPGSWHLVPCEERKLMVSYSVGPLWLSTSLRGNSGPPGCSHQSSQSTLDTSPPGFLHILTRKSLGISFRGLTNWFPFMRKGQRH